MEQLTNPTLWAQNGGMNGLVILALFVVLGIFLKAQAKIYEINRADQAKLMELHAQERSAWSKIVDERQRETNAAIKESTAAILAVTASINRLTTKRRSADDEAG